MSGPYAQLPLLLRNLLKDSDLTDIHLNENPHLRDGDH